MAANPSISAPAAAGDVQPTVGLAAYLRRIGYTGEVAPTLPALQALHEAHVGAIAFENLDVLLGRPVLLDLGSLQQKLVMAGRGGYCFEQNTLFRAMLEAIGFRVQGLGARVRMGTDIVRPRTHMALLVEVEGRPYLADVGFGGDGLLHPLPLITGQEWQFPITTYRFREEAGTWVLEAKQQGAWIDLYAFTLEPQEHVDYELANYYTSTHPTSVFRKTLTAQRVRRQERLILRGREFTSITPQGIERRTLDSAQEALQLLEERFGLVIPALYELPAEIFG